MNKYPFHLPEGFHPGVCLSEIFDLKGIKAKRVAELLECNEVFLSDVLNGRKGISTTMAMKLEPVIGYTLNIVIEAEELMRKQAAYDALRKDQKAKARLAVIAAINAIELPEHSLMRDRDAQAASEKESR